MTLQTDISQAVASMIDAMPFDLRAECETLAALEPESAGVRLHPRGHGVYSVVWVNRWLGDILVSDGESDSTDGTDASDGLL